MSTTNQSKTTASARPAKAAPKQRVGKRKEAVKGPAKTPKMTGQRRKFEVTLLRSLIGCTQDQRDTVRCIGLTGRHQTVTVLDSPAMRGQIMKVQHLVQVKAVAP